MNIHSYSSYKKKTCFLFFLTVISKFVFIVSSGCFLALFFKYLIHNTIIYYNNSALLEFLVVVSTFRTAGRFLLTLNTDLQEFVKNASIEFQFKAVCRLIHKLNTVPLNHKHRPIIFTCILCASEDIFNAKMAPTIARI